MNQSLKFRQDGTFTIVQFTDLHWKNGELEDMRTKALMERILLVERPDLIVFTGDVIESLCCRDPLQSYKNALDTAVKSGIPWAAVFGNHDGERNVTKEALMSAQLELAGTIAEAGPNNVDGVGNFVVQVSDACGRTGAALYFLDSGDYSELSGVLGYGWIRRSQVEWYRSQAQLLKENNGGSPVPSFVFFHIPLPEYRDAWQSKSRTGSRHEKVCCSAVNSGFMAAMVEEGGVLGTFCGHDHTNDYSGMLHDIRLCYGRATGYNTYGRWLYPRGARVIQLRMEQQWATWIRLANGKKR